MKILILIVIFLLISCTDKSNISDPFTGINFNESFDFSYLKYDFDASIGDGFIKIDSSNTISAFRNISTLPNHSKLPITSTSFQGNYSNKDDLISSLVVKNDSNSIFVTIDHKSKAFLDSISINERSFVFASGNMGLSGSIDCIVEYEFNDDANLMLSVNDTLGFYDKYGKYYINRIMKGWYTFFLLNLELENNTEYSPDQIRLSFTRLCNNSFVSDTEELEKDLRIIRSKGIHAKTYFFTNMNYGKAKNIKTFEDFKSYLNTFRDHYLATNNTDSLNTVLIQFKSYFNEN